MRRKVFRYFAVLLAVLFIAAQFIRPEKNLGQDSPGHIFNQVELPGELRQNLQEACMDCHSDRTNYQWYNNIAPVSWMVSRHVAEGKKSLNFSEWGNFSNFDKITALDGIYKEVKEDKMPLKSYSLIHKSARLSKEEKEKLITWADHLASKLTESENN